MLRDTRQRAVGDWMMVRGMVMVRTVLMVRMMMMRRRFFLSGDMVEVLCAPGVADLSDHRHRAEHNGKNESR